MTIQQMIVGGNANIISYIGYSQSLSSGDVASITLSAPSATQAGDLVVLFGSAVKGGNSRQWSVSGVTEVQDSLVDPNLYVGYKYATAAGETYTMLVNSAASLSVFAIAYRNANYSAYSFVSPGEVSSASIAITPSASGASIAGFGHNPSSGIAWSFTETAPATSTKLTTGLNPYVLFKKDDVSGSLTYTFTGLASSRNTQIALVSLLPA